MALIWKGARNFLQSLKSDVWSGVRGRGGVSERGGGWCVSGGVQDWTSGSIEEKNETKRIYHISCTDLLEKSFFSVSSLEENFDNYYVRGN